MATTHEQSKLQSSRRLGQAASLADASAAGTKPAPNMKTGGDQQSVPVITSQAVKVSFFFDGTGNNMDADLATQEHSNVVRLFRAHQPTSTAKGVFSYYIPGIGTRFKEIGDPGGETWSLAFGDRGSARLDWAMKKLEEVLGLSKGRRIDLALFGFSRGATLARAFALLVEEECARGEDGVWRFTYKKTDHPIRLYFMGLFDTVASVGMPMSTNNGQAVDLSAGLLSLEQALQSRHAYGSTLDKIAFASGGAPGADPASGPANGHMSWADDLRVSAMVECCYHMVAAHELRNSFPLDSVRQGNSYPKNCHEIVFPGAHSDVGGGYRKGEGARSPADGSFLSLIPLRAMRAEAIRAGVPLEAVSSIEHKKKDFGEDSSSKAAFETLLCRYKHYMRVAGWGGQPLGTVMLSHMKLYYQWRFRRAFLNYKTRAAGGQTPDQTLLNEKVHEPTWAAERAALTKSTNTLKTKFKTHTQMARALQDSGAWKLGPGLKRYEQELELARKFEDQYLTQKAVLDTMPSSDDSFVKNSNLYDEQLVRDALVLSILAKVKGRDNLRPHYRALLEAYEAESAGNGLKDAEIIAFFDTYVHDSLAGFASDATLPSDPRVIYMGGDDKLEYANNRKPLPKEVQGSRPSSMLG